VTAANSQNPRREPIEVQAERCIAEYQQKYSIDLERARQGAITTATAGWAANYAAQTGGHASFIRAALKDIVDVCEQVKTFGESADFEDAIKKAVKRLTEEREGHAAWLNRAVQPYKSPVDACDILRQQAVNAAKDEEQRAPLISRGLVSAVEMLVAEWPVPTWNDETGAVTIMEIK
jgi:hypothetical protein